MLIIKDVIDLKTNDKSKRLTFATRYLVQNNYTFDLTIKAFSFSGTSHFCVRKEDQVKDFVENLIKIQDSKEARAILDDNDSDGFVEIVGDKLGHITVTAQVGGTHEDHVKTSFDTDQTVLPKFISELKILLTYEDDEDPAIVGKHTGRWR